MQDRALGMRSAAHTPNLCPRLFSFLPRDHDCLSLNLHEETCNSAAAVHFLLPFIFPGAVINPPQVAAIKLSSVVVILGKAAKDNQLNVW